MEEDAVRENRINKVHKVTKELGGTKRNISSEITEVIKSVWKMVKIKYTNYNILKENLAYKTTEITNLFNC